MGLMPICSQIIPNNGLILMETGTETTLALLEEMHSQLTLASGRIVMVTDTGIMRQIPTGIHSQTSQLSGKIMTETVSETIQQEFREMHVPDKMASQAETDLVALILTSMAGQIQMKRGQLKMEQMLYPI